MCAYTPQTHTQQIIEFDLCKMSALCISKWKGYRKQTNLCNLEGLNNKESRGFECKEVTVKIKKNNNQKSVKDHIIFSSSCLNGCSGCSSCRQIP